MRSDALRLCENYSAFPVRKAVVVRFLFEPPTKGNPMKRRFAIPAALALTAHALLFVGSGRPPESPVAVAVVRPKDKTPEPEEVKVVEVVFEPVVDTANTPGKGGGGGGASSDEEPPRVPDVPRPEGPSRNKITMVPVPVPSGHKGDLARLKFGNSLGDGSGGVVFTADKLDRAPDASYRKEPVYPGEMKVAGLTGTVWVEFVVNENGRVLNPRVMKSTHAGFEEATATWRFEPGKHNGLPVRFRMNIPVVFNLNS